MTLCYRQTVRGYIRRSQRGPSSGKNILPRHRKSKRVGKNLNKSDSRRSCVHTFEHTPAHAPEKEKQYSTQASSKGEHNACLCPFRRDSVLFSCKHEHPGERVCGNSNQNIIRNGWTIDRAFWPPCFHGAKRPGASFRRRRRHDAGTVRCASLTHGYNDGKTHSVPSSVPFFPRQDSFCLIINTFV